MFAGCMILVKQFSIKVDLKNPTRGIGLKIRTRWSKDTHHQAACFTVHANFVLKISEMMLSIIRTMNQVVPISRLENRPNYRF